MEVTNWLRNFNARVSSLKPIPGSFTLDPHDILILETSLVMDCLVALKPKGSGPDNFPSLWLKLIFQNDVNIYVVTTLLIFFIKQQFLPSEIKINRMFFMFKNKGSKFSVANYRTISVAVA